MTATTKYRVLARKYRPASFKDLIGQEVLVQTLTNAIQTNRIAHGFMLTGIRGIGKTSTARIIAKSLNCIGADGKGGITADPCGVCENCKEITESRHVDVLEMDAASRTGVGDIREIIDNVHYAPAKARYKIYIIDEVHMLSKNAFNALLKTLEEPPEQVIFIFATTEIRKVPVTILSRCQRFDLPRVDIDLLEKHLEKVAESEQVKVQKEALYQIASAAQGSVRDSLSLLDQAIAHASGKEQVDLAQVRFMLGLVGKDRIIALIQAVVSGETQAAIKTLREMYQAGADPIAVLEDMLEFTHFITQMKVVPDLAEAAYIPESERAAGLEFSSRLSVPYLSRMWQMLVKGIAEVQLAPNTLMAAEMLLIRLTYITDLPPPGDLIKDIRNQNANPQAAAAPSMFDKAPAAKPEPVAERTAAPAVLADPKNFAEVAELFKQRGELRIYADLINEVFLVDFKPGALEIRLGERADKALPNKVSDFLRQWTGKQWMITVSASAGTKTLREQQQDAFANTKATAMADPLVKAVMEQFPGTRVMNLEVLPKNTETKQLSETVTPFRVQQEQ
ncbi:MAG: DNA polymerase III subunit gamma/tau [Proteobacteria bacterium]|nr:DNA polymerase III subunit gamma/tau [Pseudomonadota bacterium]